MSQEKTFLFLAKIILMMVLLPFVLIWFVWKKTKWNKRSKWIATAGIVVVFLIVISFGKETEIKKKLILLALG